MSQLQATLASQMFTAERRRAQRAEVVEMPAGQRGQFAEHFSGFAGGRRKLRVAEVGEEHALRRESR